MSITHISHISEFPNITTEDFLQEYSSASSSNSILMEDLKFVDLIYNNRAYCGLYIFYADSKPEWVGKCSSLCLPARIGANFGTDESEWMNHYMAFLTNKKKKPNSPGKKAIEANLQSAKRYYDRLEAADWAKSYELSEAYNSFIKKRIRVVCFEKGQNVHKLEAMLIARYNTNGNKRKTPKEVGNLISDLIK